MIQFTLIARIVDGLPLASSVDDATTEDVYSEFRRIAKQMIKVAFTPFAQKPLPVQATLTTDASLTFQCVSTLDKYELFISYSSYTTESGVCFVALCDANYARLLAFSFLQDLSKSFLSTYSNHEIQSATRPYSFIRFESEITKLTKRYMHTRSLRTQENLAELSTRMSSIPVMPLVEAVPECRPKANMMQPRSSTAAAVSLNGGLSNDAQGILGRLRRNVGHLWTHQGKLELSLTSYWLYILFWNFFFDIWFGLGMETQRSSSGTLDTAADEPLPVLYSLTIGL